MLSIYVDGSFINGVCGYGAVIVRNNVITEKLSGSLNDKKHTAIRQVAGELEAVKVAVKWCLSQSISEIDIYYDYKGIECWVTGEWKAKNPITQEYSAFVKQSGLKIKWHKVAAHTGDKWNEEADKLAKSAVKSSNKVKPVANVSQLENFCNLLMDHLDENKYYSVFEGTFNNMYGRLEILDEENLRIGIIDVYKTEKKNFTPDFRAFKDKNAETYLKALFEAVKVEILKNI